MVHRIQKRRNSWYWVWSAIGTTWFVSPGNSQGCYYKLGGPQPEKVRFTHCRDTHRISTRFFFCVKNMSRCVKYHKPGQGVGVGFCHICHSVIMRQKHLDLLESSRGPPDHAQIDTCLVSDHTYRWGPFVINDFSNLTNSLSPSPEL